MQRLYGSSCLALPSAQSWNNIDIVIIIVIVVIIIAIVVIVIAIASWLVHPAKKIAMRLHQPELSGWRGRRWRKLLVSLAFCESKPVAVQAGR